MTVRVHPPRRPRPGFIRVVSMLLLAVAVQAAAQAGFRVTQSVSRTTPTHVEVSGTVYNEARAEALDVSVTVEAIGPAGKVLSRGITYVTGRLAEGGTADFSAKVPAVSGVTSYRARVTSYRFVQSIQSQ